MSSNINVKDIIIKQKQKVSILDWSNFLQSEFDKKDFESFLSKLVANLEKQVRFSPPLKDWFQDFFNVELANVNVVVLSQERMITLGKHFQPIEELEKQGVMFFPLERTGSSDGKSHIENWKPFSVEFMDYLITNKKNIVYIFVGFEASNYADLIAEEVDGTKIFLPELSSELYDTKALHDMLSTNVNKLLNKQHVDAILW